MGVSEEITPKPHQQNSLPAAKWTTAPRRGARKKTQPHCSLSTDYRHGTGMAASVSITTGPLPHFAVYTSLLGLGTSRERSQQHTPQCTHLAGGCNGSSLRLMPWEPGPLKGLGDDGAFSLLAKPTLCGLVFKNTGCPPKCTHTLSKSKGSVY